MSLIHEMYKLLVKSAASAAEREPLKTKKGMYKSLLIFLTPVLFIVILATLSYWMPVSPLWYIICAIALGIIYFIVFMMTQVSGQVRGAIYALQNPRNGETWIEITDEDGIIWTSQKFTPLPAIPEPLPIVTENIRLPETFETWERWQRIYTHYRLLKTREKRLNETEILARIHTDLSSENELVQITDRTLRDIRKAGEKGYLTSWEKFCQMTGRYID